MRRGKSAHRSTRWVYKALHHLSYYGYVYLVPMPSSDEDAEAGDGNPQPERVVCLRISPPGSMPVKKYEPPEGELPASFEFPPPGAKWSGKPSSPRPEASPPVAVRRKPPPEVDMRVLVQAARREKQVATPPLKLLEAADAKAMLAGCHVFPVVVLPGRPAPGARIRLVGGSSLAISRRPLRIVSRARPVADDTSASPP